MGLVAYNFDYPDKIYISRVRIALACLVFKKPECFCEILGDNCPYYFNIWLMIGLGNS